MPGFQLTPASTARAVRANMQAVTQKSQQTADNAPKSATYGLQYPVKGSGYYAATSPVMFDTVFTGRPLFTFGVSLDRLADVKHWRYPLCNVGVYKYVTQPTPEALSSNSASLIATTTAVGVEATQGIDNSSIYADDELLFTGAYLYFVVEERPVVNVTTDGSELGDLMKLKGKVTDADQLTRVNKLIAAAKESLYLNAHPPLVAVTFSLSWTQVALKGLPDDVMSALHADPSAAPVTSGLGGMSALGSPAGTDDDDNDLDVDAGETDDDN